MFLEVKNLNKYYDSRNLFSKEKKQILKDVTFDVKEGEIFSIIGQSGAGKSTIGKILLGIEKKSSGDIMLMERPLEEMVKKEVQMVFQDPYSSLNPAMKIGKILEEPLKVNGVKDKKEREERVKSMLKEIGLEETCGRKYPSELSGGQRQRVVIGAAMILKPKLVVCDEPVASLDLSIQNQILNLIKKFNKEYNTTFVFISHDLGVVYNISHRVLLLYKGEVQEIRETVDFFKNPNSEYGKYFLDGIKV